MTVLTFLLRSNARLLLEEYAFVAQQRFGSGVGPAQDRAVWHLHRRQQMPHHGGITRLTGGPTDHQRTATAVDELMDLGAQTTA